MPKEPAQYHLNLGRNNKDLLRRLRTIATQLIIRRGPITMDELRDHLDEHYPDITVDHQNLWGAVFTRSRFRAVGYENATRPSSNGRVLRRWGLKETTQ